MHMNKKHLLLMLACCLIPLAGLAAIWLFKLSANTMVYVGLMLLCPVLHFVMMRDMLKPEQPDPAGYHHTLPAGSAKPAAGTRGRPSQLPPVDRS